MPPQLCAARVSSALRIFSRSATETPSAAALAVGFDASKPAGIGYRREAIVTADPSTVILRLVTSAIQPTVWPGCQSALASSPSALSATPPDAGTANAGLTLKTTC